MGRSSEELRNALESRGLWRDFVLLRDDAKRNGMGSADARREAVRQVAPDLLAIAPSTRRGRPPKKRPVEDAPAVAVGVDAPRFTATAVAAPAVAKPSPKPAAKLVPKPVPDTGLDPRFFEGKKATVNASMQWVLSNVGFPLDKIDLSSAPTALAYSTLVLCHSSPSILNDVMRTTINKLLAKEDASNQYGGDDFDGKTEYDLASAVAGIVKGEA